MRGLLEILDMGKPHLMAMTSEQWGAKHKANPRITEALEMRERGATYPEIAKALGVDKSTVRRWMGRK